MNLFHSLLGFGVIGLNGYVGVRALFLVRWTENDQAVATLAAGSLVLQLIVGFFMLSNAQDLSVWHYIAPVVGVAALLGARLFSGRVRLPAIGAASIFVVLAALLSFATAAAALE